MKLFLTLFLLGFFCSFSVYAQPSLNMTVLTTSSCTDGTMTIDISGGDAPFFYNVYNRDYQYTSGSVSFTHLELTGLPHGEYYIRVYDQGGFYSNVEEREKITSPFELSFTKTPITCNNNGKILIEPQGGTAPYTYNWNNGATTPQIENLSTGVYFLTVTDANGCTSVSDSMFVEQTGFQVYPNTLQPYDCHQLGKAEAVIYNGDPVDTYSYYWKTTPVQTTAIATALMPGDYDVVVTDAHGCIQTGTASIWENSAFRTTITSIPADCEQSNGTADAVIVDGGTVPYSYLWNNGATTSHIENLAGGNFVSVVVTDAEGCISSWSNYISKKSPVQVTYSSTPSSCNAQTGSVTAIPSNGTAPYSYNWYDLTATTATVNNLRPGYYFVQVKDANGCTNYTYASVEEQVNCKSTISGTIYNDLNGNCTQDSGEEGIPYAGIKYGFNQWQYANSDGYYEISAYPGTYTLSVYPYNNYKVSCTEEGYTIPVTAGGSVYPNNNFFITPEVIVSDANISLYSSNQRPGFTNYVAIWYGNLGTQNENATITYTFSEGWDFSYATIMPDVYDANTRTATWHKSSLHPGSNETIAVYMKVPLTTNLGDILTAEATIGIENTDESIGNNTATITTVAVNSYDPNDIQVSPQGSGNEGFISEQLDALTYRIRFQNTGSDVAYNVSVKSKIDTNLEDYTISILDVSHDVKASIYDDSLRFEFIGINLSDSTSNEAQSHGYIIYRVNKKSELAPLTEIFNKADIYFDYNVPVETNQVKNTIQSVTPNLSGLESIDDIVFYPNPCRDHAQLSLNIKQASEVSVQLYSANGQQISLIDNKVIGQGLQVIDLNLAPFNLSAGLYVAKILANDKVYTKSIIINK